MDEPTDEQLIIELVKRGVLIGVEVFGTDRCCQHFPDGAGIDEDCPACGFGLMDTFGPHSVGSDCNRAERWLLRPRDDVMTGALDEAIHREPTYDELCATPVALPSILESVFPDLYPPRGR